VHFDPRSFSLIHDLQDTYHGAVQLKVVAYTDDGRLTTPVETAKDLTLRPAEYRQGIENGLSLLFQMRLPGPGVWQIRAVVADGGSDRMGSASQFIEIPNVRQNPMAISGLMLSGTVADVEADPKEGPGVRIFRRGQSCTFRYSVFNAMIGLDKRSSLEVQTRIFAEGRVVFEGRPGRVDFEEAPIGTRRQIVGNLKLSPQVGPGDFILQVTVRDLLALPGQPRTVTQFTDFQVRE
jgi:hypothetical protein